MEFPDILFLYIYQFCLVVMSSCSLMPNISSHFLLFMSSISFVQSMLYPSAMSSNNLMLNIITSSPMLTMISSAKLNQPSTMAVVPTPLSTLPFAKSCAMIEAATEAVCCHRTDTRTKIEATKIRASATCETALDGKDFVSRTDPSSSTVSCHEGNESRRRKQKKAKITATILVNVSTALSL